MARKGRPETVANAVRRAVRTSNSSVLTKGSKPRRVEVVYDVKPVQEKNPKKPKKRKKPKKG